MDWSAPIDAYCERTGAAFWAEPVNAATNLAFLLAAGMAFAAWRQQGGKDRAALALILLVGVIGVGSFLFHTFADRWSVLADVVPIAVFIHAYFALALYRFVGLGLLASLGGTLVFVLVSQALTALAEPLVGSSASYVPALLALFGIGGWLGLRRHAAARPILAAGAAFALSLTFRTLDEPLCVHWPLGLHFLWHVLNAVTLGLCLMAAIRHRRGKSPEA